MSVSSGDAFLFCSLPCCVDMLKGCCLYSIAVVLFPRISSTSATFVHVLVSLARLKFHSRHRLQSAEKAVDVSQARRDNEDERV